MSWKVFTLTKPILVTLSVRITRVLLPWLSAECKHAFLTHSTCLMEGRAGTEWRMGTFPGCRLKMSSSPHTFLGQGKSNTEDHAWLLKLLQMVSDDTSYWLLIGPSQMTPCDLWQEESTFLLHAQSEQRNFHHSAPFHIFTYSALSPLEGLVCNRGRSKWGRWSGGLKHQS